MPNTTYSKSVAAGQKRIIDLMIMGNDMRNMPLIDFTTENYIKALIKTASKNTIEVGTLAPGLQFFLVQGGAEGFLDASYVGNDASHFVIEDKTTTSGKPGTKMIFDDTNLLAVFDQHGKLVSSALLSRPISITNPNIWTEPTANAVIDAWDNQTVSLYHNQNFSIKYYGLQIDDSAKFYSSGKVRIDIHKQEDTNGCIFIIDENTPPLPDDKQSQAAQHAAASKLSEFEPQLIKDVQKVIGAKQKHGIGKMRVIKIK
jgi:hypothetical protein